MTLPIDVHDLAERVGQQLGNPVHIKAAEFPTADASGVLFGLPNPTRYVIGHQAAITPGHQAHVVFHELTHLVRGHLEWEAAQGSSITCRGIGEPEGMHNDSDCGTDGRTDSGDGAGGFAQQRRLMEWEAETGATILTEWSRTDPVRRAQAGDGDPVAVRFASALMGAPWT